MRDQDHAHAINLILSLSRLYRSSAHDAGLTRARTCCLNGSTESNEVVTASAACSALTHQRRGMHIPAFAMTASRGRREELLAEGFVDLLDVADQHHAVIRHGYVARRAVES